MRYKKETVFVNEKGTQLQRVTNVIFNPPHGRRVRFMDSEELYFVLRIETRITPDIKGHVRTTMENVITLRKLEK